MDEGHVVRVVILGIDAGLQIAHVHAEQGAEHGGVAGGVQAHGELVLLGVVAGIVTEQIHAALDHDIAVTHITNVSAGIHGHSALDVGQGSGQGIGGLRLRYADHIDHLEGQADGAAGGGPVLAEDGPHPAALARGHAPLLHAILVHGHPVLGEGQIREGICGCLAGLTFRGLAGGVLEHHGVSPPQVLGVLVAPPHDGGGDIGGGEGITGAHVAGVPADVGHAGVFLGTVAQGLLGDIGLLLPALILLPGHDAVAGDRHIVQVQVGVHPQHDWIIFRTSPVAVLQLEQVVERLARLDLLLVVSGLELSKIHVHQQAALVIGADRLRCVAGLPLAWILLTLQAKLHRRISVARAVLAAPVHAAPEGDLPLIGRAVRVF